MYKYFHFLKEKHIQNLHLCIGYKYNSQQEASHEKKDNKFLSSVFKNSANTQLQLINYVLIDSTWSKHRWISCIL